MTRVNAKGYFDAEDSADARYEKKRALNAQRTADYRSGAYALAGGVVDPLRTTRRSSSRTTTTTTRPRAATIPVP